MTDRSLVAFTLLGQTAAGVVWAVLGLRLALGPDGDDLVLLALAVTGLLLLTATVASTLHLGRPANAWRALANLRSSWLSREILATGLLAAAWLGTGLLYAFDVPGVLRLIALTITALAAAALVYAMARVYRIRTVPAWNHGLTTGSFFLTALSLGPLLAALLVIATRWPRSAAPDLQAIVMLAVLTATVLAIDLVVEPLRHAHDHSARLKVDPGLWPLSADPGLRSRPLFLTLALLASGLAAAVAVSGLAGSGLVTGLLTLALLADVVAQTLGRAALYRAHARLGL